jgi:mycothiol synthase
MRPVALRTFAVDSAQDAVALFESRGFQPVRVSYRMWRDLREPIPNLALPQGMTLRNYGADIDRPLMEAHDEAFSDHWGHEPMTEADWRIFVIGRSSFRRDLTLVAMDGEQIAGFSINRYSPEENAVDGVNAAWIGSLGTRRAYRQRGIASALLCESMRAFHAMGCDYAALGVDSENLTGALRLYERVGFFVRKRFVTFDKIVE